MKWKLISFFTVSIWIVSLIIYAVRLEYTGVEETANTINGFLTPYLAFFTAILLFITFDEQRKFNKEVIKKQSLAKPVEGTEKIIKMLEDLITKFEYTNLPYAGAEPELLFGVSAIKKVIQKWVDNYALQIYLLDFKNNTITYDQIDSKIYSVIRISEIIIDKIIDISTLSEEEAHYLILLFLIPYELEIFHIINAIRNEKNIVKRVKDEAFVKWLKKTYLIEGIRNITYGEYLEKNYNGPTHETKEIVYFKVQELVGQVAEPIIIYFDDLNNTIERVLQKIEVINSMILPKLKKNR